MQGKRVCGSYKSTKGLQGAIGRSSVMALIGGDLSEFN